MKLHEDSDDFVAAMQSAAKFHKIPDYVIEKDYWITKVLLNLSKSATCRGLVVFKGGTSLSKGYSLIKRFSEDIDLALFPKALGQQGFPSNQGKSLHKVIQEVRPDEFEQDKDTQVSDHPIYKRLYKYPTKFTFPTGSIIHPRVVVESTLFGDPCPAEVIEISSLVGEWLRAEKRESELVELGLQPFKVLTSTPEKTFCEKVLAVMKRSEESRDGLAKRARHFYDLHRMFESKRISSFLGSVGKVREHFNGAAKSDQRYEEVFKKLGFNSSNYKLFQNSTVILDSIRPEYEKLSEILFNDELPKIEDVRSTIDNIGQVLMKL